MPEVRLVGEDGKQIGVIKTADALSYAQERDLDLVEVAAAARPPVCRILDYSKYRYEQAQKAKAAKKHQQQITIREIKFRPKIAQNDYDTKKGHVTRFLKHKDKVKITIMFRGREVTHPERGVMLLERLAEELAELAVVEQRPIQDGRNMTMMLGPSKAVLAEGGERRAEDGEVPAAEAAEAKPVADARPAAADARAPAADDARPAAAEARPPAAAEERPAADDRPAPAEETPKTEADGAAADDGAAEARPAARRAAARRPAAKRAAAR